MLSKVLGVRIFDLEACGACNLSCPFCPRDLLPPTGNMSLATFAKFLDHVPLRAGDNLAFVGIGEPTMNRRLPEFLALAKARYPRITTWITSNGTFLNEKVLPPLLDAGLDTLDVSFNGLEKETYERLMKGARFETVLANLEYAAREVAQRGHATRLQVNFIVSKENAHKEESIKVFWRTRGIRHFRVQRMHDRNGDAKVAGMTPQDAPGLRCSSCAIFDVTTFITWEGHVMHCCHDIPRKYPIADINVHDWAEIARRKAEIRRTGAWPQMCGNCTDPLRHDMREKIDAMIRSEVRERIGSGMRSAVRKVLKFARAAQ
ncbi:MAG: radical SAM protein [Planctomycetes bacterium]|nr:radical SAM protein [Planctomycetota bacterium]